MNSSTSQWLRHILSITNYVNRDRVYKEFSDVLSNYSHLIPKYDKYVHKGCSYDLLGLSGIIPVSYRNANYNIPIAIWVLYTFPMSPPEFVVMPTEKMKIVISKHVNVDGKISHPYLTNWPSKAMQSSIMEFLSIIRGVFSVETPVIEMKSKKQMPSYLQPSRYNQPPPNLCIQQSPPRPPKPMIPTSHVYNQNSYIPTTNQSIYNPGQPTNNYNLPIQSQSIPTSTITSNILPNQNPIGYPSIINKPNENQERKAIIQEVQQKLKNNIINLDKEIKAEIDKLLNDNKELNINENRVNNSTHLFEEEMLKVNNNITLFQTKNSEISEKIDQLKNREEINPDDIITATPLMNQLINISAEESAIEDMIYYLGKALSSEKIDLKFYLKNIRSLSRELFLKKVFIKKIRAQAQLL